jgi:hypothetical protein
MSDVMSDPATGPSTGETLDIKALGRKAREAQISGNALLAVGLGLAVLIAALLLWAGIVEGLVRAILLLIAAAIMPARFVVNRLSGLTRADGYGPSTNSVLRRWLSYWEAAGLVLAAGFCAFGSGYDIGPVLGGVCAGFLLLAAWREQPGYGLGVALTAILMATTVIAVFEPAWGWRGQSFLGGLSVIAAVLIGQAVRHRRPSSTPPVG